MAAENSSEWWSFADADLDTAQLLRKMRPRHYEIICYHCEQAAEKYLKGYLIARNVRPPKTHELDELCALCSEKDKSFDELAGICGFLTQFGVQPRYPYEMDITEKNVEHAVKYAERVKNFTPIVAVREENLNK
ncbi:MAG: HEPN domain-containing protein [Candidatus Margulisbacteria bacterium]|jgi:HEPN domain-containing protein|nr:HEPN domain-containing protein [Candidatus Margulisiibacteriota bacterium]